MNTSTTDMTLTMPRPLASIEAFRLYAAKIGLPMDQADMAYDYWESNGWMVGRVKMKSWEAALRNWNRNFRERQPYRMGMTLPTEEPIWAKEKRLKAELEVLRAKLFRVGDVSPLHTHEQAAQIRAARQPILDRIKQVKIELGLL
jgi:hypothetical protein